MSQPVTLKIQTHGGLNNKSQSETMPPPFVASAVNLDFADNGEIRKRQGQAKIYSGVNCESFFQFSSSLGYFFEDGDLKELNLLTHTARMIKAYVVRFSLDFSQADNSLYLPITVGVL